METIRDFFENGFGKKSLQNRTVRYIILELLFAFITMYIVFIPLSRVIVILRTSECSEISVCTTTMLLVAFFSVVYYFNNLITILLSQATTDSGGHCHKKDIE